MARFLSRIGAKVRKSCNLNDIRRSQLTPSSLRLTPVSAAQRGSLQHAPIAATLSAAGEERVVKRSDDRVSKIIIKPSAGAH
jgi:hypothetical protein